MSSHTEDWSQTEQEWTRMIKKIGWLGFSWFYNNNDCCNYKRICPGIKNMCNFKQTFMSSSIYKWFINELSLKYLACHWKIITYCHFNTLTWYFDKKTLQHTFLMHSLEIGFYNGITDLWIKSQKKQLSYYYLMFRNQEQLLLQQFVLCQSVHSNF